MSGPIYPRGKNSKYQRDWPRNASAGLDAVAREWCRKSNLTLLSSIL